MWFRVKFRVFNSHMWSFEVIVRNATDAEHATMMARVHLPVRLMVEVESAVEIEDQTPREELATQP